MPRAKKGDDKAKPERSAVAEADSVQVDVDSFIRIRDSVVTGLATIQDALSTLSAAYIKHSNTILGDHAASLDIGNSLSALQSNPLLSGGGGISTIRAASPPRSPVEESKKEKKKRMHDPFAPKRPLTPYFLYMQTARPIIANDLGPEVAKGAVATEGVRRWNAMAPHDKQLWNSAYTDNLKLYNARMHAYKISKNIGAKDMSDDEALHYAELHNIGIAAVPGVPVELGNPEALLDAPADDDEELLAPPPMAAPTPKGRSKPRGSALPTPSQAQNAIVPPGSAKATPGDASAAASGGNKRKRAGAKKSDEPVASIEKGDESAAVSETPKGKGASRKKAKA